MDRQALKGLLREIGINGDKYGNFKDSKDNLQICCPFHGETRPSCGINVHTLVGSCFACGEHFNLTKLVAHCMEWEYSFKDREGKVHQQYDYRRAEEWLEEKYNVEKRKVELRPKGIIRIEEDDLEGEEDEPIRYETPRVKLALYKSGKAIHQYFYDRGFTKETAKKFLVGWDEERKRITVPVLWEDGAVCGIIGRAVLEMRINGKTNPAFYKVYKKGNDIKYYIYDGFPVGDILFPLPQFKLVDDLAILVEGQYDCMWLHQLGFPNALSSLGSKLTYERSTGSCKQIDILHSLGVKKVLLLRDPDEAGQKGTEHDYKLLKRDFSVFTTEYPQGVSDPQGLTREQMITMLKTMRPYKMKKAIKRIED